MKISRDGILPQVEPVGWMEPILVRLGAGKRILQQSSFPMQALVLVNTSISSWSTNAGVRTFFHNDARLYALTVTLALAGWMGVYYTAILPGEQGFGQGQSQRADRSPLKRDTEDILSRLDTLETEQDTLADGGSRASVVVPECPRCNTPGQPAAHKGADVIECPDCEHILFREVAK